MLVVVLIWMLAAFMWGMVVCGLIYKNGDYLPPCPTEDSTNCYWDASENGNSIGNDVVNP